MQLRYTGHYGPRVQIYGRFTVRLGLMPPHLLLPSDGDLYYVLCGRIGIRENASREWHFGPSIPVSEADLPNLAHRVWHWLAKEPARVADLKEQASELYYSETREELTEVGRGSGSSGSDETGEQFPRWLSAWERDHLSHEAQYFADLWRWRHAQLVAVQQAFRELEAAYPEVHTVLNDANHTFVNRIQLTDFCEGMYGEELVRYGAFVVNRQLGYRYHDTTYLFDTEEGAAPSEQGIEHFVLRYISTSRSPIHLFDWYGNGEGVLEWETVRDIVQTWSERNQTYIHARKRLVDQSRNAGTLSRATAGNQRDLEEAMARYDAVQRALASTTGNETRDIDSN